MIFIEKKRKWWQFWKKKYEYFLNEAFGSAVMESPYKLSKITLDRLSVQLMGLRSKSEGRVYGHNIRYSFTPRSNWVEDEKEEKSHE